MRVLPPRLLSPSHELLVVRSKVPALDRRHCRSRWLRDPRVSQLPVSSRARSAQLPFARFPENSVLPNPGNDNPRTWVSRQWNCGTACGSCCHGCWRYGSNAAGVRAGPSPSPGRRECAATSRSPWSSVRIVNARDDLFGGPAHVPQLRLLADPAPDALNARPTWPGVR